jgi:PAS domain S-box-containing protein
VLDRNCTLLFRHFERRYPYLIPVAPPAVECLLVPFYVDGQAVGTIWAITHNDLRKFDGEDERLLNSLAQFASLAHRTLDTVNDLKLQISAREQAEAAVRDLVSGTENRFRRLVDANIIGIFLWNLDGGITDANDGFLRIVGYNRDDLVGGNMRWMGLTPPEWRERDERAIGELGVAASAQPYEKEFFRKNGSRVPVLVGGALFEPGGNEGVGFVLDLSERKRAENALRRSETYLAEAQRLSRTGSWHWKAGTGEAFWSREYYSIFGFDPEKDSASYSLTLSRIHPDDRENVDQARRTAAREKRDYELEYRLLLPGGAIRHLHTTGHCLVNPSGEVEFIGTVMDITERKQEEFARRYSDEKYRVVVETAVDAVICIDEKSLILYANQATAKVFGYEPAELLGKPLTMLMPSSMRGLHEHGFGRYVRTGHKHISWQGVELTALRKNGEEFPVEVSFGELEKSEQRVFTGFIRDITERKRAVEALRRSEGYLAEAQRLTHSGSWAWDVRDGSLFWSRETFRIYGCDPDRNPTWGEFLARVHPDDRSAVEARANMESSQKNWADSDGDFRILMPDGRIKHVHSIAHPVKDAAGNLAEIVGTVIDVTERRLAEQERERLRQAQADLAHINRVSTMGELTASLSHEIKQPIAAAVTDARTCMRWLSREQPNLAEAQEAATRLIKDVTRASDIISRISSLFKKEAGQREYVNVNDLVLEMVALVRAEAARYFISLQTNLAPGLPEVLADRVQLQQVFMNLMLNGIEAMKDQETAGRLTITSQQLENRQIQISVSDTGVGLPAETREKIFDAFVTSKSQGTGMGLPISRSIIESHGGSLWATPNDGPGATFQFTLPLESSAHQTA